MSKVVTLTLNPSHESKYGEYANLPVFDAHGNTIGYAGGEVPEHGHPCEFKVIGDEGFTSCASSSEILRLRDENAKLHDALKALMVGTNAELCADRDAAQCRECPMRHDDVSCTVADAMELLGCDMYGEPMEGES